MKSNYRGWILLALAALLTAASCKSAPPTEDVPPPDAAIQDTTPPDQVALDSLAAAAERAAAARKLAADFDAPALFPPDWQSADALYTQAETGRQTATLKETQESAARYNAAAGAFDTLAAKTIPRYFEERQKELAAARDGAVKAGAAELVPDFLAAADGDGALVKAQYEAKEYYAAKDAAGAALFRYGSLKTGLDAYGVRQEIFNRGFVFYDPQNVEFADGALQEAARDYEAGAIPAARDKAEEALVRYNLALKTAWESFAAEKGAAAGDERQKALDLKANVAVRQDFNAAQTIYTQAAAALQAQKYEDAAGRYEQCRSMFAVISQVAREKQLAAEEALRKANEKMAASDEAAKNAEIILEGGEE